MIDLFQMEWVSLFGVGERQDFDENSRVSNSPPLQAKKDSFPHAMGLFERGLFISHKMET